METSSFYFQIIESDTEKNYEIYDKDVRIANSWAEIKPTAPSSAFDKKNLIEFLLDFLHYLYNYYIVCVLSSHTHHVTSQCDTNVTSYHVTITHNTCDMTLSYTSFYVVSPKEKEKKSEYK